MADPGRPQHEAVGGVGRRSAAAVLAAEQTLLSQKHCCWPEAAGRQLGNICMALSDVL